MNHWILRDGEPVSVPMVEWSSWLNDQWNRVHAGQPNEIVVAKAWVDDVEVSTVFLADIDRSDGRGGPPGLLWETMVIGGAFDDWRWRYMSRPVALAHHDQVVAALRAGVAPLTEGV